MPHFLIKKEEIKGNYIELVDNDNLLHISVSLRAKINEKIKFIDENQTVFECVIRKITKNALQAEIVKSYQSNRILKYDICLIQSVLMNDAQNLLIANATQTGVKEIYPVISDNVSVSKKTLNGKTEKWQKISYENFKQCERGDLAVIHEMLSLKEAVLNFKKENILIFVEKDENISMDDSLKDVDVTSPIAVVIGPEGGFSENEFIYFKENKFKLISLGSMIYKAPNAVVAGISNIVSRIK